jgi:hypothetical protein
MSRLPRHSITESIGHEDRGTAIIDAGGVEIGYDDTAALPLIETIKILQEALATIPEEYRGTAKLNFSASGDYASLSGGGVTYLRPETDEELADRRRWLKETDGESEANERRQFERLKAKFG